MGDPNGNWGDIRWTAKKLWDVGISILPLDGNGKPLHPWQDTLKDDVSRLSWERVAELLDGGAEGLAIALGSSLNGDLWCRTFDYWSDYMACVTLVGQHAKPLPCTFMEGQKTHVLFLLDDKSELETFEETGSGRYLIETTPGLFRGRHSLLRIPPGQDLRWIQEPVLKIDLPNQSNLHYYDAVQVGLLPPF